MSGLIVIATIETSLAQSSRMWVMGTRSVGTEFTGLGYMGSQSTAIDQGHHDHWCCSLLEQVIAWDRHVGTGMPSHIQGSSESVGHSSCVCVCVCVWMHVSPCPSSNSYLLRAADG
jgi:hypothetical protein